MTDYITPFEEFGYEVSDGWVPIVKELHAKLNEIGDIEVFQIKSKFGELRCYADVNPDCEGYDNKNRLMNDLIDTYEKICKSTCEWCGSKDGVTTKNYRGWIWTLCKNCAEKKINSYNNK